MSAPSGRALELAQRLWELTGEIGDAAERGDERLGQVYPLLDPALDECERAGLILDADGDVRFHKPPPPRRLRDRLPSLYAVAVTLGVAYVVAMAFGVGYYSGRERGAQLANEVCYCARQN